MKKTMLFAAAMMSAAATAQQIEQTITLKPGWNAVYVSVAPKASSPCSASRAMQIWIRRT